MSTEWKPGDLAMARGFGGEFLVVRTGVDVSAYWSAPCDWPNGEREEDLTFRPLVVIDPEDREQIERLTALVREHRHGLALDEGTISAALREFANPTPPKPDEPQGLGAVVEDADGRKWVYIAERSTAIRCWRQVGFDEWRDYDDIAAVRILSEGVTA